MTVCKQPGDTLLGERVICTCKKISKPRLYQRTKTHRGKRIVLEDGVECVIEKEVSLSSKID